MTNQEREHKLNSGHFRPTVAFCDLHRINFNSYDGCPRCIAQNRVFSSVTGKTVEPEVLLKNYCKSCESVKPWYMFKLSKDGPPQMCFKCQLKEDNRKETIQKFKAEYSLNKLIQNCMKNKMPDLRNHLFETIEKLRDGEIKIEQANAICQVAQTIINTGKLEVEFMKAIGGVTKSEFLQIGMEGD